MKSSESVALTLLAIVLVPLLTLCAWVMFVMLPVMFYTEAECLRKGYPKYNVSIGLERYCSNLNGAVTVRVDKVSK